MFYKGIEFNIIQGIEPGVWQAIDKALAPKNPDDAAIGKP
jgi:hypothetical protein